MNNALATELIGFEDCVGQEISLNGMRFTVVGVLAEDDSVMGAMTSGTLTAYIPYTSLMRLSSLSCLLCSFQ